MECIKVLPIEHFLVTTTITQSRDQLYRTLYSVSYQPNRKITSLDKGGAVSGVGQQNTSNRLNWGVIVVCNHSVAACISSVCGCIMTICA